jgi:hypothetical protein
MNNLQRKKGNIKLYVLLSIVALPAIVCYGFISIIKAPVSQSQQYWYSENTATLSNWAVFGVIFVGGYLLPSIVAAIRNAPSFLGILLLNIFVGWTFIGWIISLIWASVNKEPVAPVIIYQNFPVASNDNNESPENM